jgi:hypothetical protein
MAFASVYTNCETAISEALGAPGSHQRTRISCYAASDRTACAAFFKESRMQFNNATNLDRKSGVPGPISIAEGHIRSVPVRNPRQGFHKSSDDRRRSASYS